MSVKRTTTMRSACRMNSNDIEIGLKEKIIAQDNIKHEANNSLVSPLDETQSSTLGGGRLQFFKDGKFILELARSKAGEKFGWVSVPKKVLNSSTNTTIHSKNEICASVSDDNSSIQSSPWQRDHIWRKSVPRKDISKEMCMSFIRSKDDYAFIDRKVMRGKRRRPYDKINPVTCNGNMLSVVSNQKELPKNIQKEIRPQNHKEIKHTIRNRQKLSAIIQKLIDKIPTGLELSKSAVITSNISNFSTTGFRLIDGKYQSNISPRKRILRELEKVTLDDSTKRSRSKNDKILVPNNTQSNLQTSIKNYNPTDEYFKQHSLNANYNKVPTDKYCTISPSTKLCSSYSIHSLLGNLCNSRDNNEITRISPDSAGNKLRRPDDNYNFNTTTSKLPVTYSRKENEAERIKQTLDKCNYKSSTCRADGNTESKNMSAVIIDDVEKSSNFPNDTIDTNRQHGLKKKQLHSKESNNSVCNFLQHYSPTKFKKEVDFSSTSKTFPHSDTSHYDSSSDMLMALNEKISTTIPPKNSFLTAYPLLASTFSNPAHINNFTNSEICPEQSIIGEKGNLAVHNSARGNKSLVSNNFLGACNAMSMSSLNYMYPENIPLSICHNGSPRFIPSGTYFHPYAIAALRNPLWTHQTGIPLPAPIARLPSVFPFNRINTPMNSVDMSPESSEMRIENKNSEMYTEEDCNSDIPLNLSKHS